MKIRKINLSKSGGDTLKYRVVQIPLIMIVLALVFSAFTIIPQNVSQKNDTLKDKKLDLLEKLENGIPVNSEEIKASYGENAGKDLLFFCHEFPSKIESFYLPPIPSLTDPFFYSNDDCDEESFISDSDLSEIREKLSKSMEEVKQEIESFRHSEDFMNFQDELKKWSGEFKKDMDRIKEEAHRPGRETRNRIIIHGDI
jgi:hypothetical protein